LRDVPSARHRGWLRHCSQRWAASRQRFGGNRIGRSTPNDWLNTSRSSSELSVQTMLLVAGWRDSGNVPCKHRQCPSWPRKERRKGSKTLLQPHQLRGWAGDERPTPKLQSYPEFGAWSPVTRTGYRGRCCSFKSRTVSACIESLSVLDSDPVGGVTHKVPYSSPVPLVISENKSNNYYPLWKIVWIAMNGSFPGVVDNWTADFSDRLFYHNSSTANTWPWRHDTVTWPVHSEETIITLRKWNTDGFSDRKKTTCRKTTRLHGKAIRLPVFARRSSRTSN